MMLCQSGKLKRVTIFVLLVQIYELQVQYQELRVQIHKL